MGTGQAAYYSAARTTREDPPPSVPNTPTERLEKSMTTANEPKVDLDLVRAIQQDTIDMRMKTYHEYPDILVARYLRDRLFADLDYAWSDEHGWLERCDDGDGDNEEGAVWVKADESVIVQHVVFELGLQYCHADNYDERAKWIPVQSSERVFGIMKLLRSQMYHNGAEPGEKAPDWSQSIIDCGIWPWVGPDTGHRFPTTKEEFDEIERRRMHRLYKGDGYDNY